MINALCSAIYIDPSGFKMLQLGQGTGVLHEAHPARIFPCCCSAIHTKHGCRAGFLLSPHFCGEMTSKDGSGSYSLLNALHTPTDNLDCSLFLKTNSKKACSTLFLLFRLLFWASIGDYKNALVWTTQLITITITIC